MEDKKEYVNRIYRLALGAGLCDNKKAFADLLGMSRGAVSSAMNGSETALTDKFMQRVKMFARTSGLEEGAQVHTTAPVQPEQGDDWKQRLIESQQRTIESQQRTIEVLTQIQSGVSAYTPTYAQKKLTS